MIYQVKLSRAFNTTLKMSHNNYQNKEQLVAILKEGSTIACHECDLLVTLPNLQSAKTVSCPRCGYVITRFHKFALARGFSYALAGVTFCLMANIYPFLTLSTAFNENTISLIGSISILIEIDEYAFAFIFFSMILLFPLTILVLLLYMLSAIYLSKPFPYLIQTYKTIFRIKEWAMAEVFLIGTLVSLVKVISIAQVELEIGFWSYILFAIFLSMAINSIDKLQSWRTVYQLTKSTTSVP